MSFEQDLLHERCARTQGQRPRGSMDENIARAEKEVARMCRCFPYMFPEYQRVQIAKDKLAKAQEELKAAQLAWYKLSHPGKGRGRKKAKE